MSHYYLPDATPAYYQTAKTSGELRPTTSRDAVKLGLVPGVTEVLKLLDKPQLNDWRVNNAIECCHLYPALPDETLESYKQRIFPLSENIGKEARDKGTLIHGLIEKYLNGEEVKPTGIEFVDQQMEHVKMFLTENKFVGKCEERFANELYAGKIDFQGECCFGEVIVDFKTQATKEGKPVNYYDGTKQQLAAYGKGKNKKLMCIVISTTELGRIEYKIFDDKEIDKHGRFFDLICQAFHVLKLGK